MTRAERRKVDEILASYEIVRKHKPKIAAAWLALVQAVAEDLGMDKRTS